MDGDLVNVDPESERAVPALAARIAWEVSARVAAGDRVDTQGGIEALAALIADCVVDGFVIRERTDETPRYKREAWRPSPR